MTEASTADRRHRVGGVKLQWSDLLRIVFGLIWAIDAVLKWLPGFRSAFFAMTKGAGQGQPSWLHWWFKFWTDAIQPHPHVWAYAISGIETSIAVALILGVAGKVTYVVTAVYSLGIWAVAEGFGGPYGNGSTDIGTAVIYALVAIALLVMRMYAGPSRYSLDRVIARRVRWWPKVAEVRVRDRAR